MTVTSITGDGPETKLYKAFGGFKSGWRKWRRVGGVKVPLWHPGVRLAVLLYEQDEDLLEGWFREQMRSIKDAAAQFVTVPRWAVEERVEEAVAMLSQRVDEGDKV